MAKDTWAKQVEDYYWYKYMSNDPVVLPEPIIILEDGEEEEVDVEVERNDIIGIYAGRKGFSGVLSTHTDAEFKLSPQDAKVVIENSRPYKGKINGKTVESGMSWEHMEGKVSGLPKINTTPSKKEPDPKTSIKNVEVIPVLFKSVQSRPKPKQIDLSLKSIDTKIDLGGRALHPLDARLQDLMAEASQYIGLTVRLKARTLRLSMSETQSTSLITRMRRGHLNQIFINIQPSQLAELNKGKLDASIIAQAVTHELGHYIWNEGVVRASDKMRFKKLIAGKRFHPDQYNHKQGYPWYEEHWAMLCEYLVHGRSARNLQSRVGAEIAAKYFYNEYMQL